MRQPVGLLGKLLAGRRTTAKPAAHEHLVLEPDEGGARESGAAGGDGSTPAPPELAWPTIQAADLGSHPDLMRDLFDRTLDGVVVEGIYTPDEMSRVLAALEHFPEDQREIIAFGWLIGLPLGMITEDEPDRSRYLDAADEARATYLEMFGFDPHERIAAVLAPCTPGIRHIGAPESGRHYNAGQLRGYTPGRGGLPAHVGNEFRRQLENGAMSNLVKTTVVDDRLSYFVVLQRPEQGGELAAYDLTWEDNDGRDSFGEVGEVQTAFPRDDWIESVGHLDIDAPPGALVLFGGGWRWHRVNPPEGTVERVTYGGFVGPSADGTELHYWS